MNDSDALLPRAAFSSAAMPAGMTSLPMPSPAMTAIVWRCWSCVSCYPAGPFALTLR
jgi:hypothetical protein